MTPKLVLILAWLALAVTFAHTATAQRLTPEFPSAVQAAPTVLLAYGTGAPAGICASPVVRNLLGAAGGALAGYLAYQVVIGAWTREESATTRRFRALLIVSGVGFGVV